MKTISNHPIVAGLVALGLACGAQAATLTVTTTADSGPGSLRQAIAEAASGDTIDFAESLAGQTIVLTSGELLIQKSLNIVGLGTDDLIISASRLSRVLRVVLTEGDTVNVSELTLADGLDPNGFGGCVYHQGGTLNLSDVVVRNGFAVYYGGGIYHDEGVLTLTRCVVSFNSGSYADGGGLFCGRGTVHIDQSVIASNNAGSGIGGGILLWGYRGSRLELNQSTLTANSAEGAGGGLAVLGGTALITQCTIASNTCGSGAGGIEEFQAAWAEEPPQVTLLHSTLAGNQGTIGGLGHFFGTLAIGHTILASQPNYEGLGSYYPDAVVSLGFNLCDDSTCALFLTQPSDLNNTPAGLDPNGLQDNGGFTPTIALLPDSPAVDAGDSAFVPPPYFDQRGEGFPRVVNGRIDIGAFELQALPQVPPRLAKKQVRDDLVALRATAITQLIKFDLAIRHLTKSIDAKKWRDDWHPKRLGCGQSVFERERSAVRLMLELKAEYPAVQDLIDRLVNVDRVLAQIAIEEATARGGRPAKIAAAQEYFQQADAKVQAGDFTEAIQLYKKAWKNAVGA
jgi:hypothetical protein